MAQTKSPFRVVIVGASIGGLALANGLISERAKISEGDNLEPRQLKITILERNSERSSFHLYPIHLAPEAHTALAELLPPHLLASLQNHSPTSLDHSGILITNPKFKRIFGVVRHRGVQPVMILRWVLLEVLCQGLKRDKQDAIEILYGRKVFEFANNGESICVKTEDGSRFDADLIVGADGIHSFVRSVIVPTISKIPTLPFVLIQLKLRATSKLHTYFPPQNENLNGIQMVVSDSGWNVVVAKISLNNSQEAQQTSVESTTSELQEISKKSSEFTYCVFSFPAKNPSAVTNKSKQELIDFIVSTLSADSTVDYRLIDAIKKDVVLETVGSWPVYSTIKYGISLNFEEIPPIVLVGDAAHPLPPYGGVAGSTTLTDGVALSKAVLKSKEFTSNGRSLKEELKVFQVAMLDRTTRLGDDATRRLYLSTGQRNAVRIWIRWILLRVMDYCTPVAMWVLSRRRDKALGS